MTASDFTEVMNYLEGHFSTRLSENTRSAYWDSLKASSFDSVMSAAREYVDSDQARFGFPKAYQIRGHVEGQGEFRRGIKCQDCGDRLEIVYRRTTARNGNPYIEQDISEIQRHHIGHTYAELERKYGNDPVGWPDHRTAIRQAEGWARKAEEDRAKARAD